MSFTWGINAHASYGGLSTAQQLDLAKSIGLTSLRVDIYDASPTTIAWLSSLVTAGADRGISILPVIVPSAAAATSEAAARAWGFNIGSALATAFPSMTWEAGNELDEFVIKRGTTGVSPSDYDDAGYNIVRGAISGMYDGIHSADPSAKVAVGITGIHFGFLQRLAGDGVQWDITSEHYYAAPGATDIATGADGLFATLAQFQRPIVMTEFNQQQGSLLSSSAQSATLVNMMDAMATLAPKYNIIGAYLYELLDEPRLAGGEAHYGMASESGVLNSAGYTVQNYLSAYAPAPPAAIWTAKLAADTGISAADKITSNPVLIGTADPNAVVHFTVDGTAVAASVTANASGNWSWTPTGLADGAHTIAASGANSGSASLGFMLDTQSPLPSFTGGTLANARATMNGQTGSAGEKISVYDGNTLLGTTTSGSDGSWSFTAPAASTAVHNFRADATDQAGNVGHGTDRISLGTARAETLTGGSSSDILFGAEGNDALRGGAGADRLIGGAGRDTFIYNAVTDSKSSASDIITDFQHGSDKIDFTNIAGINATNGIPLFQGQLGPTGNQTLNAHSVAYLEVGGNTLLLVNTSNAAEIVTGANPHASDMTIVLLGVHLGLTSTDFLHV
jgi:Ca2+-binding RTX toxin-like protein